MTMFRLRRLLALCCALLPLSLPAAENWPSRPVTIVVPYAVGGSTDIVGRLLGQHLTPVLGKPVVVENRTGGGGLIGWNAVARAEADGYTLLTTEMSLTIAASLVPNLPFDPLKGFEHVSTLVSMPHVLVVNADLPAKDLPSFIALLKREPGKYFFGSGGQGTNTHLGSELFNSLAGVRMTHVPFRGAGAALQDLLAGQVQVMVSSLPTVLPQIRAGKLRALMMASDTRSPFLPDVPSAVEAGLPGMNMQFWVGIAAPAGTPRPVVDRLNGAIGQALATAPMRARLDEMGLKAIHSTPDQARALVASEIERWRAVIKNANIKPE